MSKRFDVGGTVALAVSTLSGVSITRAVSARTTPKPKSVAEPLCERYPSATGGMEPGVMTAIGTNAKCRLALILSAYRGGPEVIGAQSE
jgi:hypothetical protein